MIWLVPLALLVYGTITYSMHSNTIKFIIKLGWAITILGILGNLLYYFQHK